MLELHELNAAARPLPRTGRRATDKVLPGDARRHNLSLVLQCLLDDGPLSRADLARATSLTRVTISDLVTELLDDGLVAELGTRPGVRTGKPATLIGFVADAAYIVALDLSDAETLHGAVVDLVGTVVTRLDARLGGAAGDDALALVLDLVDSLIASSPGRVLGAGIGTPGVVDHRGVVRQAPNLGWYDLPLADLVTDRTGLAATVANDANIAALAETTFGGGSSAGLLLVAVGHGVGGGIMLDGTVLDGPLLVAGEIGHLVVDPRGAPCPCGNRGCLETVLAAGRLRERVAGLTGEARAAALRSVGHTLGAAIAPVVSALGIADVRLYGPRNLLEGPLVEEVGTAVAARCMPVVSQNLDVAMATLAEDAVLNGATAHVRYARLGVV